MYNINNLKYLQKYCLTELISLQCLVKIVSYYYFFLYLSDNYMMLFTYYYHTYNYCKNK